MMHFERLALLPLTRDCSGGGRAVRCWQGSCRAVKCWQASCKCGGGACGLNSSAQTSYYILQPILCERAHPGWLCPPLSPSKGQPPGFAVAVNAAFDFIPSPGCKGNV
eukprot:scaffold237903_cov15-Tisochrysis_lutea.AAC.1